MNSTLLTNQTQDQDEQTVDDSVERLAAAAVAAVVEEEPVEEVLDVGVVVEAIEAGVKHPEDCVFATRIRFAWISDGVGP